MKEETSRVCILGPGGKGKTSVSLGVVEQHLIRARFLPENLVWVPWIEATSATLPLEILSSELRSLEISRESPSQLSRIFESVNNRHEIGRPDIYMMFTSAIDRYRYQ